MESICIEVSLQGRDHLKLTLRVEEDEIQSAQLEAVGCPDLLAAVQRLRPLLKGAVASLPVPQGEDHVAVLLRELIWRAQGRWQPPYQESEICHCRCVPTAVVDQAIVAGAHTPREVSHQTSASTSCGTCRPEVEALIAYRLNR